MTFFFSPEHLQNANNFLKIYTLINQDFALAEGIAMLKDPKERTCRYCGHSYPKVTFNNKAHTIPEFLGNTHSVSDFECDTCNKQFGKLEKQLSNFFGASITLNRTRGKKKIPTSPSYGNKIIAKKTDFFGAKNAIEFGNSDNSTRNITYDKETGQYNIEFTTQPYIPYDVYKALLKLALGLIPESDLQEYNLGFQLLQDIQNKKFKKNDIISVHIHNLLVPYTYTGILLFKKVDSNSSAPPLSLVLFYGQLMFQIYIPFSLNFIKNLKENKISVPLLPPILPSMEDANNLHFSFETERLDSITPQTRKLNIRLIPDTKDVKMVSLDPVTMEMKNQNLNPNEIVKFIIIDDENFSIKPS